MNDIFEKNNINIGEKESKLFSCFADFLLENNKKFNITAIREREDVFLKHFCDSLMGREFFEENKKILEVGSGGGFPSVPLKIFNSNFNFTLMEATLKKCNFLIETGKVLGFENFEVLNCRAEEGSKGVLRESFDFVTARAVASLNILSELCLPYLKKGGKAVFYKNYSEEEIDEGKKAVSKLGGKISLIKKYTLSGLDDERCIIVIEKKENTSEKYPREYKKIIKSPL